MLNGIINVYKEVGYTSFDVVAKLRGITKQKKIGHTGTLDPDATGVLTVCLGSATKLVEMMTDKDKAYVATMILGKTTDTQDISGEILSECPCTSTEAEVRETIARFVGEQDQIPPMYSAVKVNGRKLYELAREGKVVERKARRITIHDIEVLEVNIPVVKIKVTCSKGTYIRTLCHDIGEALGCGAVMSNLVRIRSGNYTIETAKTLDEISEYAHMSRLEELVIPVDSVFSEYAEYHAEGEMLERILNGNMFGVATLSKSITGDKDRTKLRVYDDKGEFIALYRLDEKARKYVVDKMFLSN